MKEYINGLINDLEDKIDDLENKKNDWQERFSNTNLIERDIDIIKSKQEVLRDIKNYLMEKYFNNKKVKK